MASPPAAPVTEFAERPYRRVHVRDLARLSTDDLVAMISSLETPSCYWAGGVLFASFAMTESEELAKKEMGDEMYLDRVVFARCERFARTVRSSGNLEIGVINMEGSAACRELAAWIKSRPAWGA
ncbi:conserved hypothetical protein [Nitrosopumilaceae archaeon]|nr:conserved hypothetical protein [Nitrosopumilaceae archaeon]